MPGPPGPPGGPAVTRAGCPRTGSSRRPVTLWSAVQQQDEPGGARRQAKGRPWPQYGTGWRGRGRGRCRRRSFRWRSGRGSRRITTLSAWRAGLALVVALALQIGVNYANDYSDGIKGTDEHGSGPIRLVGSGLASPRKVLAAAWLSFFIAGVAGLVLAIVVVVVATGARGGGGRGGVVLYRGQSSLRLPGARRGIGLRVFRARRGARHRLRPDGAAHLARARRPRPGRPDRLRTAGDQQPAGHPDRRGTGKRTLAVVLGDRRTRRFTRAACCSRSRGAAIAAVDLRRRSSLAAVPLARPPVRPGAGTARSGPGPDRGAGTDRPVPARIRVAADRGPSDPNLNGRRRPPGRRRGASWTAAASFASASRTAPAASAEAAGSGRGRVPGGSGHGTRPLRGPLSPGLRPGCPGRAEGAPGQGELLRRNRYADWCLGRSSASFWPSDDPKAELSIFSAPVSSLGIIQTVLPSPWASCGSVCRYW